jgi:uncharacterized protein (TIGR03435 family)
MLHARSVAGLFVAAGALLAQSQQAPLAFEVASVKPAPAPSRNGPGPLRGGPGTDSPGQLTGIATLKVLLERAYLMKEYQVSGPAWMDTERYQIAAKIPAGATREQVPAMLRALLAERFHLVVRRETRQLPFYALLVAKGGPKFRETHPLGAEDDSSAGTAADMPENSKLATGPDGLPELPPGANLRRSMSMVFAGPDGIRTKLWARQETMQQLADRLGSQLNRPVIDMTELPGQYDFTFAWSIETAGGVIPRTNPPPDRIEQSSTPVGTDLGLSLSAAVEAQLGLKLERRTGPVDVLIVDRADRIPTGN